MTKRSRKNKRIRLAAIAAALSTGGIVIALLPSANADEAPQTSAKATDAGNCQEHYFEVSTEDGYSMGSRQWSVYGDLNDAQGKNLYHWEDKASRPKERNVHWTFNYCGDNAKGHIWIDPSRTDQFRRSFVNLELDRNYCWKVRDSIHEVVEVKC